MNALCSICPKLATTVHCTNCKLQYCSSACKKAHRKHKCQFIPSAKTSQNNTIQQTMHADYISIKTERSAYMMYLPARLRSIIYPDGKGGSLADTQSNLSIIILPDGTFEPKMNDRDAMHLFGTLFERNREKIPIGDKTKGFITAKYRNYIELAEAFADNDISKMKWTDDKPPDEGAIRTMDKYGRSEGVLFGRLMVGKKGRDLSKMCRLDIIKLP